jgi:hypothetical protein
VKNETPTGSPITEISKCEPVIEFEKSARKL